MFQLLLGIYEGYLNLKQVLNIYNREPSNMKYFLHILSIFAICILLFFSESGFCAQYPETLNSREIAWLKKFSNTPIKYVIPPKFVPVSFVENGSAGGIVKEYITLLEEHLGLKFQLLDVSWKKGMELARKGEVDLFPCLSQTPEREEFLTFIENFYIEFPMVIVTEKNAKPVRKVEDLDNRLVALDKNLVAYSKLKNDYSNLNIDFLFVQTNPNALKAVHLGQADAALSSSAVAGYMIAKNGWNTLKIAGETGWPGVQLKMGVKKDWPMFASILDKTIASIPDSTRMEISNKWIPIHFEHSFDSTYVIKRILPFFALISSVTLMISLFLAVVMKKNRQLRDAEKKIQKAYIEIHLAREKAEEASRAKSEFLDNSGQGFLSFGDDLIVDPEYSRECETLFEQTVAGKNICDLLFIDEDPSLREVFQRAAVLVLNETLDLKQDLYLSLLKPRYKIGKRHIKAEYRLIANHKIMLVLTDITPEIQLRQDVLREQNRLKFIISAVQDTRDFCTIIEDLKLFKEKTIPALLHRHRHDFRELISEIYRHVHTFKGLFAQQEFLNFPAWLHSMESRISKMSFSKSLSMKKIEKVLSDFQNEKVLEQDLGIIREVLGDQFMEPSGTLSISNELAFKIESMARKLMEAGAAADQLMEPEFSADELRKILVQATHIRHVNLKTLLNSHVEGTVRLSRSLGKQINQFQAEGDDIQVDPDQFIFFTRSLVNVFRNALDHGIESPEDRLKGKKPECAKIRCSVKRKHEESDSVEISIADDGRGIDLHNIEGRAVQKGLMTLEQLKRTSDSDLMELIFTSEFSTCQVVNAISGRGVGLYAVKAELEKLNGRVEVKTEVGKGTIFKFNIPL